MAAPIPLLLCGKFPTHIEAVSETVKPEFIIIKACSSIEVAEETIEAVFKGEAVSVGGEQRQLPQPHAIIMGGGFTNEDQERAMKVSGAKTVPWFRPGMMKPGVGSGAPAGGPPSASDVAGRLRKGLDEHYGELMEGTGAGNIWYF